ncbi:hypothetical protein [Porphyromonas loveana]|uniref:hypothetical protein n=2 Tax=Porphyromonas loveana TaxID=1884669 RepID=UPI00359FEAB2
MANKRTALKGKKTDPAAQLVQEPQASIKRTHKSTQHIVAKLKEIIVDFLAIEDLSGYDVDLINLYDEEMTLRISGNCARMDVRIVSLMLEGGEQ